MRTLQLLIAGIGMTQDAVATEAGISAKHLSQILLGRGAMSDRTAVGLGRALGVPAAVLILAQHVERSEAWLATSSA